MLIELEEFDLESCLHKKCLGCDRVLFAGMFSRHSTSRDGLRTRCKNCLNKEYRAYLSRVAEEEKEVPQYATCSTCKKTLSSSDFSRCKSNANGLQRACRNCRKKLQQKLRSSRSVKNRENPPERPTTKSCIGCKATKAGSHFGRCSREQDGFNAYCNECVARRARQYRKRHPEKAKAAWTVGKLARRARQSDASGSLTHQQIESRFAFHGNRCVYCGSSDAELVVEHQIPLSRGGTNYPANIVPACRSCNSKKHSMTPKEFKENF